jgi:hypothetical protein
LGDVVAAAHVDVGDVIFVYFLEVSDVQSLFNFELFLLQVDQSFDVLHASMGVDGELSVHRSKHHSEVFVFMVALARSQRIGVVASRPSD